MFFFHLIFTRKQWNCIKNETLTSSHATNPLFPLPHLFTVTECTFIYMHSKAGTLIKGIQRQFHPAGHTSRQFYQPYSIITEMCLSFYLPCGAKGIGRYMTSVFLKIDWFLLHAVPWSLYHIDRSWGLAFLSCFFCCREMDFNSWPPLAFTSLDRYDISIFFRWLIWHDRSSG